MRLPKVIAVAREDNFSSRMVIGAIGMTETGRFTRDGVPAPALPIHPDRRFAEAP